MLAKRTILTPEDDMMQLFDLVTPSSRGDDCNWTTPVFRPRCSIQRRGSSWKAGLALSGMAGKERL